MPVTYTILYPRGAVFDVDYYINKHMPLAKELLPEAVLGYKVFRLPDDAPYSIQCETVFSSEEAHESLAHTESGRKLLQDLSNFSTAPPVIMLKTQIASSE